MFFSISRWRPARGQPPAQRAGRPGGGHTAEAVWPRRFAARQYDHRQKRKALLPAMSAPASLRLAGAHYRRPRPARRTPAQRAGGLVAAAPLRGAHRMAGGRNRNAVSPAVVGGRAKRGIVANSVRSAFSQSGRLSRKSAMRFSGCLSSPPLPARSAGRGGGCRGRPPASAQFRFDAELLCLLQLGPVEGCAGFGKAVKVPYSVTPAKGSPCGGVFEAA
ncbi:MAG: hypothetical protein Pg6A_13370 [Termitinemataceae bacterium]|nr:MAG: hypothetical protein Pg6A_13370 [Termitinemataceae bacterium]